MTTSGEAGQLAPGLGPTGLDEFELDDAVLAPPPRRKRLPFATAALGACVMVGVGVVGGIAIQKHWGVSSNAANGRAAAFAALGRATGASGVSGRSGPASQFARGGTIGTVKAIDGRSLYVTDAQGNVVKVTTTAATTVRVTQTGSLRKIKPGDNVVVQGAQTASGYSATSITDSGSESALGGFGGGSGGGTGFGGVSGSGSGTGFGGSKP